MPRPKVRAKSTTTSYIKIVVRRLILGGPDPSDNANRLYLFDVSGRIEAKKQLYDDIPRLVTEFGDAVGVGDFYGSIYNATPAHMDDVHAAIIENPDIEVITEQGGERRVANTIKPGDVLRMKMQRSFFPIFPRR